MAKSKNLGWASPDDQIYQNGGMIHFRIGPIEVHDDGGSLHHYQTYEVTPSETGLYGVAFDFYNWEAGSCLDSNSPQLAIFSSLAEAEMYFESRVVNLSKSMIDECKNVAKISSSHWGLSGYTWYCVLFESDETRDKVGWCELISAAGDDGISTISNMVKRFDGSQAKPAATGFDLERLEFVDVEENVYGAFSP